MDKDLFKVRTITSKQTSSQHSSVITLESEYLACRNFCECCPNSRKFKMRKILYWPCRQSLCSWNFSHFCLQYNMNFWVSIEKWNVYFLDLKDRFLSALDPNVSLKYQIKDQLFCPFAKVYDANFNFGRFAKAYAREMQIFPEFFGPQKFLIL